MQVFREDNDYPLLCSLEVIDQDKNITKADNFTNFFELGGHSLKATMVTARIRDEFNIKFPLGQIFK